jgi:endonuclease I
MRKLFNSLLCVLSVAGISAATVKTVDAKALDETRVLKAEDTYYQSVNTSSGQTLQDSLQKIIVNHKDVGYPGVWKAYYTTDIKPGTTDKIWDMYSNYEYTVGKDQAGTYKKEGDCYNREHSVPKSWFSDATPMHNDIHHLYPTDGKVNGMRSNYAYGEVGNATYVSGNGSKLGSSSFAGYSGTVFEPIDEYKGDFARTYFYMSTCYADRCGGWTVGDGSVVFSATYPHLTKYATDLFCKWAAQDPVSQKEIDRNNAVYEVQGNRNPFIDHPEWISMVYESSYNKETTVDQAKVDAVVAKISALPTEITLDNKKEVNEAQSAYNALNYKEKPLVTNYDTLEAAVLKIKELGGEPEPEPTPTPTASEGFTVITKPQVGREYYFGLNSKGTWYYINGQMSSYYGATVTNPDESKQVKIEAAEGGYYIKVVGGQYINAVVSGKHKNFSYGEKSTIWTWDDQYHTFVTDLEGSKVFLGTFGTHNTFSVSDYSKISGADQYIAQLLVKGDAPAYDPSIPDPEKAVAANINVKFQLEDGQLKDAKMQFMFAQKTTNTTCKTIVYDRSSLKRLVDFKNFTSEKELIAFLDANNVVYKLYDLSDVADAESEEGKIQFALAVNCMGHFNERLSVFGYTQKDDEITVSETLNYSFKEILELICAEEQDPTFVKIALSLI